MLFAKPPNIIVNALGQRTEPALNTLSNDGTLCAFMAQGNGFLKLQGALCVLNRN